MSAMSTEFGWVTKRFSRAACAADCISTWNPRSFVACLPMSMIAEYDPPACTSLMSLMFCAHTVGNPVMRDPAAAVAVATAPLSTWRRVTLCPPVALFAIGPLLVLRFDPPSPLARRAPGEVLRGLRMSGSVAALPSVRWSIESRFGGHGCQYRSGLCITSGSTGDLAAGQRPAGLARAPHRYASRS